MNSFMVKTLIPSDNINLFYILLNEFNHTSQMDTKDDALSSTNKTTCKREIILIKYKNFKNVQLLEYT